MPNLRSSPPRKRRPDAKRRSDKRPVAGQTNRKRVSQIAEAMAVRDLLLPYCWWAQEWVLGHAMQRSAAAFAGHIFLIEIGREGPGYPALSSCGGTARLITAPKSHKAAPLSRRSLPEGQISISGETVWCGREDSNFHGLPHSDLNAARLPIPPRPHSGLPGQQSAGPAVGARP